ncbi:MAG: DJ-1/PfpI family protein [Verrucomicrobia bacterium]|nr:DJ-1/PfpI family protein [Verrucomicrobiota bacterium]
MKKRVLCLLVDGFEETEVVTPVNLMRRGGIEVVMASLHGGVVEGRGGIRIEPDEDFAECEPLTFDLLYLPGGPGVMELRQDGRAAALAGEFHAAGKAVAAICAAPLLLHDAGLLNQRRFTAHFSVHGELPGVVDERVVEDGLILTSRGPGTAVDFGLALVGRLAGAAVAREVAAGIMA